MEVLYKADGSIHRYKHSGNQFGNKCQEFLQCSYPSNSTSKSIYNRNNTNVDTFMCKDI